MSLWYRIANVFRAERLSREIDEELQAHIDEAIENGREPAEVRRAFGGARANKARRCDCRDEGQAGQKTSQAAEATSQTGSWSERCARGPAPMATGTSRK